jgi:O-antigen/teichoic acid export membrane protein
VPQQREPLIALVRAGLGWSFLSNVLGRVGTLLSGIVLARILSPEDYGVFAVALVALNAT